MEESRWLNNQVVHCAENEVEGCWGTVRDVSITLNQSGIFHRIYRHQTGLIYIRVIERQTFKGENLQECLDEASPDRNQFKPWTFDCVINNLCGGITFVLEFFH